MMNYELFKEAVTERFKGFMPAEFQDYTLNTRPVVKVNQTLDSLSLVPDGDEEWSMAPTFYINNMYERYQECEDLPKVLQEAADAMVEAFHEAPELRPKVDFDSARDNIIMVLINTEQNREMLEHLPHRDFQDLSIIYRWVMDRQDDGISSSVVNNGLAEKLSMTEEMLYQVAFVNTKELFPPTVRSMTDVLMDMMKSEGQPEELVELMFGDMPEDEMMYVISNDRGINGAASILYEDELHKLAKKLDTDLYILPSSLHECIAVSAGTGDPNDLARMVNEINMDQVSLEERLSNQVYHYDKDLRKLTMATDTPNKRLDGICAEAKLIYDNREQSR
ncbi:DUF5688 family protein [Anaerobium acetethylicum]|uniref:Uncharacterized protein n=1 Tax=Anaerobium acetethylicum TaxID=1619234 RepID=A0A1D3TUL1_9FIRM|nr:DUF5688 family protein [Anaerobium acetethylicum]SCP97742.1 hypothetical protein SAMN05421730_101347 [Anaerobium acetethylicum]